MKNRNLILLKYMGCHYCAAKNDCCVPYFCCAPKICVVICQHMNVPQVVHNHSVIEEKAYVDNSIKDVWKIAPALSGPFISKNVQILSVAKCN